MKARADIVALLPSDDCHLPPSRMNKLGLAKLTPLDLGKMADNSCGPGFQFTEIRLKQGSTCPVARSGHRIVYNEADGNIYSLGGYNPDFRDTPNVSLDTNYPLFVELWKFSLARKKWTQLKVNGRMPRELASHAIVLYRGMLLTYGGSGVPFGESNNDSLDCCDLATLNWSSLDTTGEKPNGKYGHTMTLLGHSLILFGGTTGYVYNTDIHVLDLKSCSWELLSTENSFDPTGRQGYRHEVSTDGENLFLFGGGTSSIVYGFDEIACFNFEKRCWRLINTIPDKIHGFPSPRRCHSCVQLRNCAYICGGFDGTTIFGDVWKFDMASQSWTKLGAELAQPVYFHSAAVTEAGCMYVFGGVVEVDVVRTNTVHKLWLTVPSLKELAWEKVCACVDLDRLDPKGALELGIPQEYVDRLDLKSLRRGS